MNTEKILIDDNSIEIAKNECKYITSPELRSRAVANCFAVEIASKYFDSVDISADRNYGLRSVENIILDLDISDIYVKGSYIDVRLCYENGTLLVPKAHYDMNLTPAVYMFIKVTEDLKEAQILGFIPSDEIGTENLNGNYIVVNSEKLVEFDSVQMYLMSVVDQDCVDKIEILKYLENTLDSKIAFYRNLISSEKSREVLKGVYEKNVLLKLVSSENVEIPTVEVQPEDTMLTELVSATENLYSEIEEAAPTLDIQGDFSTQTTPSFQNYEEGNESELDDISVDDSSESNEAEISENSPIEEKSMQQSREEIDTLFPQEDAESGNQIPRKRASSAGLLLTSVLLLVLIGAGGYYGYNFFAQNANEQSSQQDYALEPVQPKEKVSSRTEKKEAMPVESIEKNNVHNQNQNEGNSVAIPAIEQNLDASVLVSNLKVDWEVPAGYASNTSAKRYLIKLGKVIQLNLKTELLLLSKPPISNKISVEIKFNNDTKKFETVGIVNSSGESSVDSVILQTLNKALGMNISVNTDSFGKLQGNPILIIHL